MRRPDLAAAGYFLAGHARVLDRRRFERLFAGGPPQPVLDALHAYLTPDGGFGYGLEPDGRTSGAQPLAIEVALRIMHDADAWDDAMVLGACDWLLANAPAAGGAVATTPAVLDAPHAPWWAPQDGLPASPVSTGQLLGTLLPRKVDHPWCDGAVELMWTLTDRQDAAEVDPRSPEVGYRMLGIARFLDVVGDAARAEAAIDRLASLLTGAVALDPAEPGDTLSPLWFAPDPGGRLRRLFGTDVIEAHLDRLAAGQAEDGGWTFGWPSWSPVAEADWRGALTVDALATLRHHDRLA